LLRLRFDAHSALIALLIFMTEVLIATVGAKIPWLRGFWGDVLAVMWVYYCLKTFVQTNPTALALVAFGVGCCVELGQYIASVYAFKITNPVLRIILGSTADWWDVLAYGIGFILILILERFAKRPVESA
jgi:glycopeptide antibiotics resistance protein